MISVSTPSRFDALAIWLHWSTALLVLAQFATALSLGHAAPARIDALLAVHRSTGLLLWGLTAARAAWRLTFMDVPPAEAAMPRWQRLAAHANAFGLYVLLLVQPVTGLVDSLYHAHPFTVFGATMPVLVAKSKPVYRAARSLHEIGAWLLTGLVALHAAAALFHGLVRRDGVLRGMLPAASQARRPGRLARP